jgi:hypothetical protein
LQAGNIKSPLNELRTFVVTLVQDPTNDIFNGQDKIEANIYFTINSLGEIVILTVDAVNEDLKDFVKQRMNYKKTSIDGININEQYIIKVNFVKRKNLICN